MIFPSESDHHLSIDHPLSDRRLEVNLLTGKGLDEYADLKGALTMIVDTIRDNSKAAQRKKRFAPPEGRESRPRQTSPETDSTYEPTVNEQARSRVIERLRTIKNSSS